VRPSCQVDDLLHLVPAARSGDANAFRALHARYARMVHAILLSRLVPAEAEDQVQEVFLAAWTNLAQLDEARGFGGWLATIARNRAVDCLRRRRPTEPLHDGIVDGAASPHDLVEAQRVIATIRTLPEAYRETLVMRLCEGMSGPEIAIVTGLEPGSVRVNLHRGMMLLREKLGIRKTSAANE
jgi:RNA polymerase sigma-70 factor (ECF subfamily)